MRSRRGVTLLELVTVLVILGMILAIAVPLMRGASRSMAVPSARTHLVSMIKTARDTSRIENTPTWVIIETNAVYCIKCNRGFDVGTAVAGTDFPCPGCQTKLKVPDRDRARLRSTSILVREPVGQWHFEDAAGMQTSGQGDQKAAIKSVAKLSPVNVQRSGKIGAALFLDGRTWVETPDVPLYDPQQGVAFEFWMFRDDSNARQNILRIGGLVNVFLESRTQNVVPCPRCGKTIPVPKDKRCPLCGADVPPGAGAPRQCVVLVARIGSGEAATVEHVPALEWIKVEVIVVAGEIRIYLNDVLAAAKATQLNWVKPIPLIVGDKDTGLRGIIDELGVDLIVPRDTYALPPELYFELGIGARPNPTAQLILTYDREGRLDRSKHSQPILFKILTAEGEEAQIQVDLNGTVPR